MQESKEEVIKIVFIFKMAESILCYQSSYDEQIFFKLTEL